MASVCVGGAHRTFSSLHVALHHLFVALARCCRVTVTPMASAIAKLLEQLKSREILASETLTAEVVEPVSQGEKLYIHKFRAKKGYRRKTGHRQSYTTVKITGITG